MEKISSILGGTPRVKAVDMEEAHPIRPGVPSFGRPEGRTSLKDRFTVSQEAKDIAFKETLAARNPKEFASAKIAEEMTANFFNTKLKPPVVDEVESEGAHIHADIPELRAPMNYPKNEEAPMVTRGRMVNREA